MRPEEDDLARYRNDRCERSFARLVESNLGLVIAVANRVLHNPELARDAAQKVFTRLAVEPAKVPANLPVEVWLHRTTRSIAIDMVRAEEIRRRHEQTAARLAAMNEPDANWSRLAAEIDRALDELPTADRIAIVLRFFKNRSHAEVGAALGVGSDASYMRIQRALTKLRRILSRRGLTFSAAALAAALPAHASASVSTGLPATITSMALSAASTTSVGIPPLSTLLLMKAKTIALPAACTALLVIAVSQRMEISKLSDSTRSGTPPGSSIKRPSRTLVNSPAASLNTAAGMLGEIRRLCSIEPLTSREIALHRWAEQFTDSASMLEVAKLLREADELSPTIRGRAAKVLIERWAVIDTEGAMEAFTTSALLAEESPFGSIRLDPAGRTQGFELIARNNPTAFSSWLNENPNLVLDLFLEKPQSPEGEALIAAAGRDPGSNRISRRMTAGRHSLIRQAPFEVLAIIEHQAAKAEEPLTGLIFDSGLLGRSLVARAEQPHEVWSRLSQGLETTLGNRGIADIASAIASADSRPLENIFEEIDSLDSDWSTPYRLASLGPVLADEKAELTDGDLTAENRWWANFETYGELVNTGSNAGNSTYDATRRQMAVLGADADREVAIEWAKTIVNADTRFSAASAVTLRSAGIENARLGNSRLAASAFGEEMPEHSTIFLISSDSPSGIGLMVSGNAVEIPENPSVEEVIRATEQAMEEIDFPESGTSAVGSDVIFGASQVGWRLSDDTLGTTFRDRLTNR